MFFYNKEVDFLIICPSCHKILAIEERGRHAPSLSLVGRVKLKVILGVNPYLVCVCGHHVELENK